MARSQHDMDFVPRSYDELYEHYIASNNGNSIVKTLVRHFLKHSTEEEMETLPNDIFLRCLDKQVIEGYDPTKANFGGVIYFVTRSVCVNYLSRKERDPLGVLNGGTLTTEDPDEDNFQVGVWNLDRFVTPSRDHAQTYEATEQAQRLYDFAQAAHDNPKNKRDQSLLPLLNLLMEEFTPQECAEQLKVTTTTIFNWMKYLRDCLANGLTSS